MPENNNKDFYLEDEDNVSINDGEITELIATKITNPKVVTLFKGEELTIDQLIEVTYRYPANKVYILGEHDSGKTTILATLFEMFQVAPFHGFYFAGSLTQIGFEKRCFHSRLVSENKDPDTERTKSEEFRFLHIALKSEPLSKNAKHLLISDISGEKIKRAKSNSKEMQDLGLISDATHVSYIIDGQKLLSVLTRQSVLTQARTFIRKAIDEKVFNNKTRLSVIVSKWDLLEEAIGFDFQSLVENSFNRDFSSQLEELSFLKVAVRPSTYKSFKLGHGLVELLKFWFPEQEVDHQKIYSHRSNRMINNLMF